MDLKIFEKEFRKLLFPFLLAIVIGFFSTEIIYGSVLGLPNWVNIIILIMASILIGFQL